MYRYGLLLNGNSGIARDLATMAQGTIAAGGCEIEEDGEGSQGTAEPNFITQPSTSPEPIPGLTCSQKQIKPRPYPSKEPLPQKVVFYCKVRVLK